MERKTVLPHEEPPGPADPVDLQRLAVETARGVLMAHGRMETLSTEIKADFDVHFKALQREIAQAQQTLQETRAEANRFAQARAALEKQVATIATRLGWGIAFSTIPAWIAMAFAISLWKSNSSQRVQVAPVPTVEMEKTEAAIQRLERVVADLPQKIQQPVGARTDEQVQKVLNQVPMEVKAAVESVLQASLPPAEQPDSEITEEPTFTPGREVQVKTPYGKGLYWRTAPDPSSPPIQTTPLPDGTRLEVLEQQGDWLRVRKGYQEGWVRWRLESRYIAVPSEEELAY